MSALPLGEIVRDPLPVDPRQMRALAKLGAGRHVLTALAALLGRCRSGGCGQCRREDQTQRSTHRHPLFVQAASIPVRSPAATAARFGAARFRATTLHCPTLLRGDCR